MFLNFVKGTTRLSANTINTKSGEISISFDAAVSKLDGNDGELFRMGSLYDRTQAFSLHYYKPNIILTYYNAEGKSANFTKFYTVSDDSFVNFRFDVNLDNKTLNAYVNGQRKTPDGAQMYINTLSSSDRYFDADHRSEGANFYLDNLKITKYAGNKFNYGAYYDYFDGETSAVFGSACADGVMTVAPGDRKTSCTVRHGCSDKRNIFRKL